ncbi:uracil-DNA glycosylase [Neptunomonas sp. XY-337]|uniref:uracil-DNA glycosylase n=1 Tax=Neptunomonas sp. XY-337 TaxID=2561897 RepID=UPI0010AAE5B9|nr:uracil-DNA glycosylase [Neptunomonas sp. XY-337]
MALDNAPSWQPHLVGEFDAPYMLALKAFLQDEKSQRQTIYPHSSEWFHAFECTPLEQVKVVIIGQDPYHQPGQAHGLCFSVRPGVKVPPSLVNIYKELKTDLNVEPVAHGFLDSWANQGVLLLNSVLTVRDSNAASHQGKGWEQFTDKVIEVVNRECDHVVFLLWGAYAQKKGAVIDTTRHCVLKAPHPSPLAAHRGFFGCRHFSQANQYLMDQGREPINWQLPADAG